ncbi:chromobox protein homolog 1-like [Pectinophora gossypiella]|uniref:chromobox protein homolog 1-like n=1 Tax=Pectinophora gossypiella TaxID=13191 RepID=UPI00214F3405|nr:chromobox protein homolog 1-like [Pectinophora gossypiella]
MRKISKTRADEADDVVSSTNGSIVNEDQTETRKYTPEGNDNGQDPENDNSGLEDNDADKEPVNTSKKSKGKRGRKKKSEKKGKEQDEESAEEEYEVEKIIDSKKIKGKLHYLIRWKGYSADSDTWEPENTLSCPDLIQKFNDEKENSKNKESKSSNKPGRKRKADKKEPKKAKRTKTEWDSEKADENAEYEVERILEVHHKKNGKREFLIHWKGWSSKFDSWEPESNLNCSELIKKFMDKVTVARSSDTRNLRVSRETTNRFTLQDPTHGRRLSKRRGQRQRVRYDDAE